MNSNFVLLISIPLVFVTIHFSQNNIVLLPNSVEKSNFPKATGIVNDFENILSKKEEKTLGLLLKNLEVSSGDQMVIVTLSSIESYETLNDYSFDLANDWGVGEKEKNNGILIALGKELREIRIQNGNGIVTRLTDAETKAIIDNIMIPQFKEDHYFEGLKKGIEAIVLELE